MSKSDVQSASTAPITVRSGSQDSVPTSTVPDASTNRLQDTKTDSLEKFRQFHQIRRENQTARLRHLQALEDQLTGATSSNQHRQRSLLSTRGDGRLRTTSLIHDDRKPKVVLGERSSDDSDIRHSRMKKPNHTWRLSNLESLNEEGKGQLVAEKQEKSEKSKAALSEPVQASHLPKKTNLENENEIEHTGKADTISSNSKRNTLQDLERLIAESARRLTESRRSIDELIQSHEIDTSKRIIDKESYNSNFSDKQGDHGKETGRARNRNSSNVILNHTMESKSDLQEAKTIDPIIDFEGVSNRISSNRSASPHHVRNRSLNANRPVSDKQSEFPSDQSIDILNEFSSMEAKEKSLLPAPLRPSSLQNIESPSPQLDPAIPKPEHEVVLSKQPSPIEEELKKSPPKSNLNNASDARTSLRKPQVIRTKLSSISREGGAAVDWMSSDIDTFQNDLHASNRQEIPRQASISNEDTASMSQTSSLSRASTSSVSTARSRKESSIKRMPSSKQIQSLSNAKMLSETESEDEALVRQSKPSNTPKKIENELNELTTATNNPYRRSLKDSPSLEQLARTKKMSLHQPATDNGKVKESMHGSLVVKDPSKTTAQSSGHRKRGRTLPGNLAERPTNESLTLPPMKVEPIEITIPVTSYRKMASSNTSRNLIDTPTRIPIAVMKPTPAKAANHMESKRSLQDLKGKAMSISQSGLTSKAKSFKPNGQLSSGDSTRTTSIPKTIRGGGGGQIPLAKKNALQSPPDSDEIQCTTSMSTPKSMSFSPKHSLPSGSQSSRTDRQSTKDEMSKGSPKMSSSTVKTHSKTISLTSDIGRSIKPKSADRSRQSNGGAARRQSYTGNDLLQEQMMRERDKATKLKANIVSAQGLITLSENITESNSVNGQRAKRRSANTLSLHERLQSLVADDKASEPASRIEWDNRSTSSSTTDDSEFRALYSRVATNNRSKKTTKDRSTQITKERPLRVAMGPQAALKLYMPYLAPYERTEILEFPQVYFVGPQSKKHQANAEQVACNFGYDDERGDYRIINQDHLAFRYEILEIMGKGSFGQVVKCFDHRTGNILAIKIIRNKKRFHAQALVEVKILEKLMKWDLDDKHNNVRMTHHFYFRNHLCIAFECLSINLYEFIKSNEFKGFSLGLIRRFSIQLLNSLTLLYKYKVVHCDLKPENVLLKHPSKSYIKVIDFGSSCLENEKVYTYIQSRFYRSPEVILGLTYNTAIDMWSLGCILAELFTGYPLFPGENEQEQLSCIMEIQGVPSKYLVEKSTRKKLFFDSYGNPRIVPNSKGKKRRPGSRTLAQALKCSDELFLDFVSRCLEWDPDKRLNPEQGLAHPWIAGGGDHSQSRYAGNITKPSSGSSKTIS
ncbi:hypothetical protein INT44_000170 [Umbelopsis vinacea]|uniref:dual-specificity kinase n=1 Tax=Umbelopsis vinacea TaxID=44442 RepID=A0A8H7PHG5_9FUNG|nr:hypothetical protein INT44_000170 [Umbelopsis vinacea]